METKVYRATSDLKRDKAINERIIERATTKAEMMKLGIEFQLSFEMKQLTAEKTVKLDELRLLQRRIEKLLSFYDEETYTTKIHTEEIAKINEELSKREKTDADWQKVHDLRAEADDLEKKLTEVKDESV